MSKIIQSVLAGMLYVFILDIFVLLGIKINYIDFYEINLYFNILFADHQNVYLYFTLSLIFGFIIMYVKYAKQMAIFLTILALITLSTLIGPIGYKVGELLLMKKDVVYYDNKYTYRGDAYYDGRTQITFYDDELKKIILLDKKDLKDETNK